MLQAIRRLNSKLLKDERVFVSVLANSDGLSLVVKRSDNTVNTTLQGHAS